MPEHCSYRSPFDGWRCSEEATTKDSLCTFHDPDLRKGLELLKARIEARLADEKEDPIRFDGAIFPDGISFKSVIFKRSVSFSNAVFHGPKTSFMEAQFHGQDTSFKFAQFHGLVTFFFSAEFHSQKCSSKF